MVEGKDNDRTPFLRARDLLSKMTLKEKIGQIAQPFKMFDEYEMKDGKSELLETRIISYRQNLI